MSDSSQEQVYHRSRRPEIAQITNHGYGGPDIPVGGAPDTGGQNLFVNTLSLVLERLGYKVTIFARGGFRHFHSDRLRTSTEYLSEHVRYVYVPGGGDHFLAKEDIAIALDEQSEWLDAFVRQEAEARGCAPWEVYEFINTHYWDAAVLGTRLVERWRNDVVGWSMQRLLEGVVPEDALKEARERRHWRAMGEVPGFHLGRLLIHWVGQRTLPIHQQARAAASTWSASKGLDATIENQLVDSVEEALKRVSSGSSLAYERLVASAALGQAILTLEPEIDERLKRDLDRVDKHVWTPHSVGELKDLNFLRRSLETRRQMKFCERRSHERMVSGRTRAIAATSAKMAEKLWTHYRVPLEETFYFPPCVDSRVYRHYRAEEAEVGAAYRYLAGVSGLSEDELRGGRIVFEASRMDQTKRKDLLIGAFSRIVKDYDGLYLFIAGGPENELFQSLERQIDYSDALEGRAFLTGAIPDEHMGPLFSIAEVYASPSEMEGFGMSVSQAAAAGTSIVSSDKVPFSVQFAAGASEIFPSGDSRALANALRRVLDGGAEIADRVRSLQAKVDDLDWERKTTEFLDYLRQRGIEVAAGIDANSTEGSHDR